MGSDERVSLVRAIHDTPNMIVLAIAGGGNAVITDLLDVPGASRTILEVRVPYAATAMADLLALDDNGPGRSSSDKGARTSSSDDGGTKDEGAVSESTARAMAKACLVRARQLAPDDDGLLGVGCTAALATDRSKKGEHRAHVAVAWIDPAVGETSHQLTVRLDKGSLDRSGEDRVVADAILQELAAACGLSTRREPTGSGNTTPGTVFSDSKDWTWVLEKACGECMFDAIGFEVIDVPSMIRQNARDFVAVLDGDETWLRCRPRADKWSPLEYGCHVRDVYELYDFRLGLMLDHDGPEYPNWDQDQTAVEKRYHAADAATVSKELVEWAEALATRFESVDVAGWNRTGFRSDGAAFTVESFARYLIHDPIHHLWDVNSD
jgi:nicotinamide mononucleotide (NMN) deamidase PncC